MPYFRFGDYDGGLPECPRPVARGYLSITKRHRWELWQRSNQLAAGELADYAIVVEPQGRSACRVTISPRGHPEVAARLELPTTPQARFLQAVERGGADAAVPRAAVPAKASAVVLPFLTGVAIFAVIAAVVVVVSTHHPSSSPTTTTPAGVSCPAGDPYYNPTTKRCYSTPQQPGTSAGSGGTSPAPCGYAVDQTYSDGGATVHEEEPTSGCYIHITEGGTYDDLPSPGPPCSSSLGQPPTTISNIVYWSYSYEQTDGSTYEVYDIELNDRLTITITGCHFTSYGSTELNHLTNYDYIG